MVQAHCVSACLCYICVCCYVSSENYLFHCTCDKCILEADEPDTTSEEEFDDDDSDCMDFVE